MSRIRLGSIVPDFSANTTHGEIQFLDWVGNSWCVLFSHPADFTPVCTTELGQISVKYNEFKKRGVKVIALSCDSLEDHNKWVEDIKSYCPHDHDVFPFPIISDEHRELAILLDMLDEKQKNDTSKAMTVRALYIIGPDHTLKLSMLYPASTGRSVDEILRVIDSLQIHEKLKVVVTPVNWMPGGKVMIAPDAKDEELTNLFPNGVNTTEMPSGIPYVRSAMLEL